MATCEDLDSESGYEKEEAKDEANVVVGLVATLTSEVEPDSDSEDENEVHSKIPREEIIESLKELLTHFELRTNELNDLKETYVNLMKQQKSTLLDLKASEEGLRGFLGLRLILHALFFMLCFIVTCKIFLVNVWGENVKSPIPGLSELKIRKRYNRQSIPGVASCIGLRDQSHIAGAFWR